MMIESFAFLDWDTCKRLVPMDHRRPPNLADRLNKAREFVAHGVENAVSSNAQRLPSGFRDAKFRVLVSLYHGWHSGKTPTDEFRELLRLQSLIRPINTKRVSVASDFRFGAHALQCGRTLFDTHRKEEGTKEWKQKMVDTSLVADLTYCARVPTRQLLVVVSDDADVIPGLITADAMGAVVYWLQTPNAKRQNFHFEESTRVIVKV